MNKKLFYETRGNTKEYIERNLSLLPKTREDIKKYGKENYLVEKGKHLLDLLAKKDLI